MFRRATAATAEERKATQVCELPKKADRVKGQIYINKKGEKGIWDGNKLLCEHSKQKAQCKECGGSSFCEHGKRKRLHTFL